MPRPVCRSTMNRTMPHVLEAGVPGGYIVCNDTEGEGVNVDFSGRS